MGIPLLKVTQEGLAVTAQYIDSSALVHDIAETSSEKTLSIFPNPTNDLIHIKIKNPGLVKYLLKIINLEGSCVYKSKITENTLSLKAQGIKSGVYMIIVQNEKGLVHREKLILQ